MKSQPKIALIYDKVNTKYGGAEIVLKALHQLYPDAPLYTSVYNSQAAIWADQFKIKTSFLQRIPFFNKYHQFLAPLMPLAFESHNLDGFDIIISITSGEAKGVITKPHQLHICYMLTPPRYLYSHADEYLDNSRVFSLPLIKQFSKIFLKYLRWWDQSAANRPDHLIAISTLIERRINKYYQREVEAIIYPPVADRVSVVNSTPPAPEKLPQNNYLLCVSRLVPYKKIDLCIHAAATLKQTLIIAGSGTDQTKLKNIYPNLTYVRNENQTIDEAITKAKQNKKIIVFLNLVDDAEVARLFNHAKVLLMPGIEDFGITALDAASWGLPTILFKESGVVELLDANCFKINRITAKQIADTVRKMDEHKISPTKLKKTAADSSVSNFTGQFEKIVYDLFIQHQLKGPNAYL